MRRIQYERDVTQHRTSQSLKPVSPMSHAGKARSLGAKGSELNTLPKANIEAFRIRRGFWSIFLQEVWKSLL